MLGSQDNARQEDEILAQLFWPAFKKMTIARRLRVFVKSLKYGYVGWRDKESNNPFLWVIKSLLKGLDLKFISCLTLSLIVSELPFFMELIQNEWNFCNPSLVAPLYAALPALLGMVFFDYILEPDLSKAILIPLILVMLLIAIWGYHCGFVKPNLNGIYIVTASIVLLSWCIKVRDRRMIDEYAMHDDAQNVLPQEKDSATGAVVPDILHKFGKKIITKRPKG